MNIIISIKPIYAEKILSGEKLFELRKRFTNKKIDKIIIYESAPVSRVVGEFEIEEILCETLNKLRKDTKDYSYVDKKFFDEYYKGKGKGYAIKVKNPKRYDSKKPITDFGLKRPPQSYAFIN